MAKVPQSGDIAEVIPASDLIRILECPICTSVPYPPIYGCVNGHIACNDCRPRLAHCGICRQPFWEGRNYVLESIVLGSKFYCNYKSSGCTEILTGNDLKKHLMTCQFGPMVTENKIAPPPALLQWIPCSHGELPPNAIDGGVDEFGNKLYVARANHEGGKIPGKYNTRTRTAQIPWGGGEHEKLEYEILSGVMDYLAWAPSRHGSVPPLSIAGGISEDGETLYIGRISIHGLLTLGKIHQSHGVCYAPFNGQELANCDYEVLIRHINIEQLEAIGYGAGPGPAQSN